MYCIECKSRVKASYCPEIMNEVAKITEIEEDIKSKAD
jgi:hypothetical protein